MYEKAVVDRVVDGKHAVLLVGKDEREHVVPISSLPVGVREGIWLKVRFEGSGLVEVAIDADETERVRARISEKVERLRRRGR